MKTDRRQFFRRLGGLDENAGSGDIVSALVRTLPERTQAVVGEIGSLERMEVPWWSEATGKIVVVFDGVSGEEVQEGLQRINALRGVVAADLSFVCHEEGMSG